MLGYTIYSDDEEDNDKISIEEEKSNAKADKKALNVNGKQNNSNKKKSMEIEDDDIKDVDDDEDALPERIEIDPEDMELLTDINNDPYNHFKENGKPSSWNLQNAISKIKAKEHPAQKNTTSLDEKIRKTLEKRRVIKEEEKSKKSKSKKDEDSDDDNEEDDNDTNDDNSDDEDEGDDDDDDENGEEDDKNEEHEDENNDNEEEEDDDPEDEVIEQASNNKPAIKMEQISQESKGKSKYIVSFSQLNLSKPLLRAAEKLQFEVPTPIQAQAIPVALTGRDVCGSALTGSGKTAAYMFPILERLLYRPKGVAVTRVLILVPTRELAQQVQAMTESLGQFTDIRSCAIVGGIPMSTQVNTLRSRPDVVIATPGRMIDHLRNTQSVDLDDVEILVLDEADRLLELGFSEELKELIKFCPVQRQTMLFSATMTENVSNLADLSLKNPVRIAADPLFDLAQRLTQEFIKVKEFKSFASTERKPVRGESVDAPIREAILVALCQRTCTTETIIFFRHKAEAHRMSILFGLLGLKAAELHGNLTQRQRLEALERFRLGECDFLLCTDVASRGLDIPGIKNVINFEFPNSMATYVHRVGRTARAGRGGRSITMTGEKNRKIMKDIVKRSKSNIKARKIPSEVLKKCYDTIASLEKDLEEVYALERVEKEERLAEMQVTKTENLILHEDEIAARPEKTWFQTPAEKLKLKLERNKLYGYDDEKEKNSDNEEEDESDDDEMDESEKEMERIKKVLKREEKKRKEREASEKPIKDGHRMSRKKRRKLAQELAEKQEMRQKVKEAMEEAKVRGITLTPEDIKRIQGIPMQKQVEIAIRKAKSKAKKEKSEIMSGKAPPSEKFKQMQDEMGDVSDKNHEDRVTRDHKVLKKGSYLMHDQGAYDDLLNSSAPTTKRASYSNGGNRDSLFNQELDKGDAAKAIDARYIGSKGKHKRSPQEVFKGHDPLKSGVLRKQGKLSVKAFKSKKRYKRR